MSKTYEFLKESGVFYVATVNGDIPELRPFGAVMEYESRLYISTADMKDVYKQMKANPSIQIVTLKTAEREWLRLSGQVVERDSLEVKGAMLEACPVLSNHFKTPDSPHFVVFEITKTESYIYSGQGKVKID